MMINFKVWEFQGQKERPRNYFPVEIIQFLQRYVFFRYGINNFIQLTREEGFNLSVNEPLGIIWAIIDSWQKHTLTYHQLA